MESQPIEVVNNRWDVFVVLLAVVVVAVGDGGGGVQSYFRVKTNFCYVRLSWVGVVTVDFTKVWNK